MELSIYSEFPKTFFDLRSVTEKSMDDDNNEFFNWSNEDKSDKMDAKSFRNKKKRILNDDDKFKAQIGSKQSKIHADNDKHCATGVIQSGVTRISAWQLEDISELNSELEGSFGGLRTDITNNYNNVNDAILSIPGLPIFKQEAPSPTSNEQSHAYHSKKIMPSSILQMTADVTNEANDNNSNELHTTNIHHLFNETNYDSFSNSLDCNILSSSTNVQQDGINSVSSSSAIIPEDCRFQYVLAAATSIATKINEETLTYLNQAQSYEIKAKKLGDLSSSRGKLLKSVIRVCFHERRLQYMEKEQMKLWQKSRPGDRILEIDVPLSYGLCDVSQPNNFLNTVSFTWDPTKEVGVYIKVNCISTEFTPRKHGGEKGVPFRLQIETYSISKDSGTSRRVHVAACQIKVFKLKGADRKHKQDREKISKRPISEQEKFQPSYECTVLNDVPLDAVPGSPEMEETSLSSTPERERSPSSMWNGSENGNIVSSNKINEEHADQSYRNEDKMIIEQYSNVNFVTPDDVSKWLMSNRFNKFLEMFSDFTGPDMQRMTKEDLIQICGAADGIRLFNSLHNRSIVPKLTIYVSNGNVSVFNAIYLKSHSKSELLTKIARFSGLPASRITDIYLQASEGIKIVVTSDVIQYIKDETRFLLITIQEQNEYYLLLKQLSNN